MPSPLLTRWSGSTAASLTSHSARHTPQRMAVTSVSLPAWAADDLFPTPSPLSGVEATPGLLPGVGGTSGLLPGVVYTPGLLPRVDHTKGFKPLVTMVPPWMVLPAL